MEARIKEVVVGGDAVSVEIQHITEYKVQFVCPKCPGSRNAIPLNGRKATVLMLLWYAAKTQGPGLLSFARPLSEREALGLLDTQTYFDYLNGRVLKVDLSGDDFDPRLYDRDNGPGAAHMALQELELHDYYWHVWSEARIPDGINCPRGH